MTSPTEGETGRRALVVGTGLIGGSIALGLRRRGWHVSGVDADETRASEALRGRRDRRRRRRPRGEVVFVAMPAAAVAGEVRRILADGARRDDAVVTDVSGVKTAIVAAADHPRFIGGHPMAGSEQIGLRGADPDLFEGAVWVLTPTAATDLEAFDRLKGVVLSLGADVLVLSPADHDRLVAVVSHVPHLVAATLMNAASAGAEQDGALLRLAAGGFRDMTRVAAGHPGIWPDICAENAAAIVDGLDGLVGDLHDHARPRGRPGPPALLDLLRDGERGPAEPAGPRRAARPPGRAAHPRARPRRRPRRDHLARRRGRHRHLRHRDRALGRGPPRRPHPGRRRRGRRHPGWPPSKTTATAAGPSTCRDSAAHPGRRRAACPAGAPSARRARSRSRTAPCSSAPWPRARSVIRGLSDGADVAASLAAVEAMGAGRRAPRRRHGGHPRRRERLHRPDGPLDCGNSGTSMRLLAGLVAGFDWETELSATSPSRAAPWTGWPSRSA